MGSRENFIVGNQGEVAVGGTFLVVSASGFVQVVIGMISLLMPGATVKVVIFKVVGASERFQKGPISST